MNRVGVRRLARIACQNAQRRTVGAGQRAGFTGLRAEAGAAHPAAGALRLSGQPALQLGLGQRHQLDGGGGTVDQSVGHLLSSLSS